VGQVAGDIPRIPTADPVLAFDEAIQSGLVGLSQDPLNCEAPPALLAADLTPVSQFFRRNHFPIPELDSQTWRLEVGGLVHRPLRLSLDELRQLGSESVVAVLECAGNGRNLFRPAVGGEQWGLGAVGNARWTGVPLARVLDLAGLRPDVLDVVFAGADRGRLPGGDQDIAFERSLSAGDARRPGALLAYAMNDEPLLPRHGYPVRLIVPGRYAVASVKWLTSVTATNAPFDGYFQAEHYVYEWPRDGQVVRQPVGGPAVRALITSPAAGDDLPRAAFTVRGLAWSGAAPVTAVEVSVAGAGWQQAALADPAGHYGWRHFELPVQAATGGELIIRARASDSAGRAQPAEPEWNRLGYGGNFIHEVPVSLG
jgi:DMSO/TMAO reductase YedYZ molybdopterin-dependent catalytic subunit